MRGGIRIGSISGIPLYIDSSWFLVISFLAVLLGAAYTKLSPSFSLGYGAITAILFFLSIASTKVAHALMSKARGVEVNSINIQFMGGANTVELEAKDPLSVFSIAIASPFVNLSLSAIGYTVVWLITGYFIFSSNSKILDTLPDNIGSIPTIWAMITLKFAEINLVFGIFSLIPALPFEGGHMLKALVWKVTGDRFTGIRWAARSGQFFGVLMMILGGLMLISSFAGIFLILLGWFLFSNAGGYLYLNNLQQALLDINAEDSMTRDFRLVDADISLREFADKFLLMEDKESNPIYIASSNGRDRGLINSEKIRHIDSSEWQSRSLQSLITPLDEIDTVELKEQISTVVNQLEQKQLRYLIVRSAVGSVAGVIDRGDIIKVLNDKLLWQIPSEYVKQIKAEGKFPPNFRLVEICQQLAPSNQ